VTEIAHPKTKKGTLRREAIMAAARELFREQGFRATSLDEIGARAGISGPAIYRYFKSKHELLSVLLEEAVVAWRETLDGVLREGTPPRATLERLIEAAVALELRNGSLRAVPPEEFRLLGDDVRSRLARLDRITMAEWVHLVCEVRPGLTDEEARAAVVMFEGMLRSVSSMRTSMDPERLAEVLKAMTLGGLLAIGAPPADEVASA
jgi:AcrR family transcriptional regulator